MDKEPFFHEQDYLLFQSEAAIAKSDQNAEDAGILLSNATDLEAEIAGLHDDIKSKLPLLQ